MKISEVLFKAREIQLERGRASGVLEDRRGCICMLGAINLAMNGDAYDMRRGEGVRIFFGKAIGDGWSIARFSNIACRTKYDMAAAFEIAACCAAAEGL
jgi:hypothetical protein